MKREFLEELGLEKEAIDKIMSANGKVLYPKTYLGRTGVPKDGRWLIVSPEFHSTLLMDDHFVRQGGFVTEIEDSGSGGTDCGICGILIQQPDV